MRDPLWQKAGNGAEEGLRRCMRGQQAERGTQTRSGGAAQGFASVGGPVDRQNLAI